MYAIYGVRYTMEELTAEQEDFLLEQSREDCFIDPEERYNEERDEKFMEYEDDR